MAELPIKNIINETLHKLSLQQLNEKTKMFQHVDLPLITIRYKTSNENIPKKRLRLYLDLIDTKYPLDRRLGDKHRADLVSQIFKCNVSEKDLVRLATFKKITKKKVITMNNENVKTISRLRWRGRDNLNKNIIHFR